MNAHFKQFQVAGISAALPKNSLDLASLYSLFGEREVKRITSSTGIHSIKKAPPEMMIADLAEAAARELFSKLNINPETIDAIVFVSQTPDFVAPATSVFLQHRL